MTLNEECVCVCLDGWGVGWGRGGERIFLYGHLSVSTVTCHQGDRAVGKATKGDAYDEVWQHKYF